MPAGNRKKVTAMCLTIDSQYLVTGDSQGLIYIWNVASEHLGGSGSTLTSPRAGVALTTGLSKSQENVQTFELHKDKGQVTNLLCVYRPLSLYGLTANMKGYEPAEIKQFSKVSNELESHPEAATTLVSLLLHDFKTSDANLWDKIEDHEESEYLIRSSQRIMKPALAATSVGQISSAAAGPTLSSTITAGLLSQKAGGKP